MLLLIWNGYIYIESVNNTPDDLVIRPNTTRGARKSEEGLCITTVITTTRSEVNAFSHSGLQSIRQLLINIGKMKALLA